MDDFVLLVMGHAKDLGYATGGIVDWLGVSIVNRMTHPDYNHYPAAPYHIATQYNNGSNGGIPYQTWQAVDDAFVDDAGPTPCPAASGPIATGTSPVPPSAMSCT